MVATLKLPKWYDLHVHFRQGALVAPLIAEHLKMGCAGAVAMPNTVPPVAKVFDEQKGTGLSIENYRKTLLAAGATAFKNLIIPLYLSPSTTPEMIEKGARQGLLKSAKYYPPHATTNSDESADLFYFMGNGVFKAMEDNAVILNIHGENHDVHGEAYFGRAGNAEESFYHSAATSLVEKFPKLKIVAEHVTTKAAVEFVRQAGPNIAASVTPQHLLYTVGDLLQGFRYHLYCAPLVKFEDDMLALRAAVTSDANTRFFAGTDSAPHTVKINACCGTAGCYTGGIAPQLYADAFERAGLDLGSEHGRNIFERFLCLNGPAFYKLDIPLESFLLVKAPEEIGIVRTSAGNVTPLPLGLLTPYAEKVVLPWTVKCP